MSLRMECKLYEGTCLVLMTSSHLCENLRLVLALVLTCNELKTAKPWSLHPSTHASFLLKAKQFKKRNVHYQNFPSLGYHGLKFSKEELAQVFMLGKALGHELYWVQTCAWLHHLRWALIPVKPTASGFTLHDHLLNYRQKDQPYMEKHLWLAQETKERTAKGQEYSVNQ